jgi:hypothetical protein
MPHSGKGRFTMSDAAKVREFLTHTRTATRNEIAGGTGLPRDAVQSILDAVVAAGEVVKQGDETNSARYSLAGVSTVSESALPQPIKTAAEVWADNARREGLAMWKKSHPEEYPASQKRYEPSSEEIDAEIEKRKVEPLTEHDRIQLEIATRNRKPRNPQAHIVR